MRLGVRYSRSGSTEQKQRASFLYPRVNTKLPSQKRRRQKYVPLRRHRIEVYTPQSTDPRDKTRVLTPNFVSFYSKTQS